MPLPRRAMAPKIADDHRAIGFLPLAFGSSVGSVQDLPAATKALAFGAGVVGTLVSVKVFLGMVGVRPVPLRCVLAGGCRDWAGVPRPAQGREERESPGDGPGRVLRGETIVLD